jgi:hypothetical protein
MYSLMTDPVFTTDMLATCNPDLVKSHSNNNPIITGCDGAQQEAVGTWERKHVSQL